MSLIHELLVVIPFLTIPMCIGVKRQGANFFFRSRHRMS